MDCDNIFPVLQIISFNPYNNLVVFSLVNASLEYFGMKTMSSLNSPTSSHLWISMIVNAKRQLDRICTNL